MKNENVFTLVLQPGSSFTPPPHILLGVGGKQLKYDLWLKQQFEAMIPAMANGPGLSTLPSKRAWGLCEALGVLAVRRKEGKTLTIRTAPKAFPASINPSPAILQLVEENHGLLEMLAAYFGFAGPAPEQPLGPASPPSSSNDEITDVEAIFPTSEGDKVYSQLLRDNMQKHPESEFFGNEQLKTDVSEAIFKNNEDFRNIWEMSRENPEGFLPMTLSQAQVDEMIARQATRLHPPSATFTEGQQSEADESLRSQLAETPINSKE